MPQTRPKRPATKSPSIEGGGGRPSRGVPQVAEKDAIVGLHIVLGFDAVDATPHLHEQGPITVRVTGVAFEGSPPTEKITALVLSPPEMVGLSVTLETRYEGEPIATALAG